MCFLQYLTSTLYRRLRRLLYENLYICYIQIMCFTFHFVPVWEFYYLYIEIGKKDTCTIQ